MPGRVFVTGGSGFVGSAIVEELLSRNYAVNALVNRRKLQIDDAGVHSVTGSLFDAQALDSGLRGCDAVIHLVGIIMEKPRKGITFERIHFEGTKAVADAAVRNGVRRYLQMSALGTRPNGRSEYHKTKFRAEQYVRESGLDWTIMRPSMIHGPRGEFMRMVAKWARHKAPPFVAMPYFGAGLFGGKGAGMLQPVYVKDLARAFVDCLENPKTIGEVYPVGGSEQLSWPELHRKSAEAIVGARRAVLAVPVWAAKFYAAIGIAPLLGFNRDQIIMSQEENTCDNRKFEDDFGWKPRGFTESLRLYAGQM